MYKDSRCHTESKKASHTLPFSIRYITKTARCKDSRHYTESKTASHTMPSSKAKSCGTKFEVQNLDRRPQKARNEQTSCHKHISLGRAFRFESQSFELERESTDFHGTLILKEHWIWKRFYRFHGISFFPELWSRQRIYRISEQDPDACWANNWNY